MRVLLLRPNSAIERVPPPLGLLSLAAWVRREMPGVTIRIMDGRLHKWSSADFFREIEQFAPDVTGITAMHAESAGAHELAALVKGAAPGKPVVIGGPYPSSDSAAALGDANIDYAVAGEGELPFTALLQALVAGDADAPIRGVVKRGDAAEGGVAGSFVADLDLLPLPAWDLVELDDYFTSSHMTMENPMQMKERAVAILSSRGCPYRCIYCHDIFGKRFRSRSAASIVEEIRFMKERYGIEEIEIIDDTFNMDMGRAKEFFSLLIARGLALPICFSNGIRIDKLDEELLDLMKRAGVYRVNFGIESASPRIQKLMRKSIDLTVVHEVIRKTVARGILAGGFFMIGFPEETEGEVLETIDLAVNLPLHTAVFAIATPFPGTELHRIALSATSRTDVRFGTVGAPTVNASAVSDELLVELKAAAYRRFYLHPRRIWRIWNDAPSRKRLLSNFIEVVRVAYFGKELYGAGSCSKPAEP